MDFYLNLIGEKRRNAVRDFYKTAAELTEQYQFRQALVRIVKRETVLIFP